MTGTAGEVCFPVEGHLHEAMDPGPYQQAAVVLLPWLLAQPADDCSSCRPGSFLFAAAVTAVMATATDCQDRPEGMVESLKVRCVAGSGWR